MRSKQESKEKMPTGMLILNIYLIIIAVIFFFSLFSTTSLIFFGFSTSGIFSVLIKLISLAVVAFIVVSIFKRYKIGWKMSLIYFIYLICTTLFALFNPYKYLDFMKSSAQITPQILNFTIILALFIWIIELALLIWVFVYLYKNKKYFNKKL